MDSKGDEAQPKRSKLTSMKISTPINIPQEIITEILLRLGVKSLLRFKSVSKSWLHLISTPEFVNTHLSVCPNNKDYKLTLGFDCHFNLKGCSLSSLFYDTFTEAFDLDFPMKHTYACVVGSVNGLICLRVDRKDLFLWNPSIRKFKKLPDSGFGDCLRYGFGYDELHDDYKVVVAYWGNDSLYHYKAKMYSLNRDSWINIERSRIQMGFVYHKSEGMFVNGRLHWVNISRSYNGWQIISIDLAAGKWGKVELPCHVEGRLDLTLFLGALGNDLSLFGNSSLKVEVWIMKEYGVKESWTKMFTINHPDNIASYHFSSFFCKSNSDEIMFGVKSSFVICNKKVNSIRFRKVINCDSFNGVTTYIESLLWPFCEEGTGDTTITKVHMKTIM